MRIAFDIDDTLFKLVEDTDPRPFPGVGATCACGVQLKQELDPVMLSLLIALIDAGHDITVWSAGGVDYAARFVMKWLLIYADKIKILPKETGHYMDICFDDQKVDLADINFRVPREHSDHVS